MPPNPNETDKKVVYMPKEMSAAIAQYRFGRQIGAEGEAIRQLILKGLEAAEAEAEGQRESGAVV